MASSVTLPAMQNAPLHPSPPDRASLVLIALQEEYLSDALPLAGTDVAINAAASVLACARVQATPIFHVQNRLPASAPIFGEGSAGFAIPAEVAPRDGERVISKSRPNAFSDTELHEQLSRTGRPELILVGAQTHMCISATMRAASDLGWRSTVVVDACATRDLPAGDGSVLPAAQVHVTALAELAAS